MRLSKSRHIKANMGNYESFDFGATATVDHGDLGYTDEEVQQKAASDPTFLDTLTEQIRDRIELELDRLLIDEIESGRDLTEEDRSMLLRAFTSQGKEPDPPTSRTSRSASADQPTSQRRPRRAR